MFPTYSTESSRRVAVGQTASGRYVQLHPSPFQQYRGGAGGDLTRIELEQRGLFYRAAVEQTLNLTRAHQSGDPVSHAFLFEKYWPAKFNYPDALYEAWSGSPKPDRFSWRLVDEFETGARNNRETTANEADGRR